MKSQRVEDPVARCLGEDVLAAMRAGLTFLDAHGTDELLMRVGETIDELPACDPVDKRVLPASYGGDSDSPPDDYLVGRGLFYITEQRRLMLDCTAGHYQMPWGYSHPDLCRTIEQAQAAGVVWDNHSNIPQTPVKRLAHRLVDTVNTHGSGDPIEKVLIGVATGTSAAAAALKMQLVYHEKHHAESGSPVFVVLEGNYHGTDMVTQYLRGMWKGYVANLEVVAVEPNDADQLRTVFERYGQRVAGFWAEPVMMNREAILVQPEYLRVARECCTAVDAALCIDEIQTGFWQPHVFSSCAFGFLPDMLVAGKGMTAGLHPLSALLFRRKYDLLAQYDALNTNGGASLAALLGLCCTDMVEASAERIVSVGDRITAGMESLVDEFGNLLVETRGYRHLAGLKFRDREQALAFHKRAVAAGLWIRAHAYHEGHSTILTKLGLLADESVADFMIEGLRKLLRSS